MRPLLIKEQEQLIDCVPKKEQQELVNIIPPVQQPLNVAEKPKEETPLYCHVFKEDDIHGKRYADKWEASDRTKEGHFG